jgi:spore germination protein GerM
MTRDPFDHMKEHNPVPSNELPSAPMSMAERIMGRRARRSMPAWALAGVAAAAVILIGGITLLFFNRDDGIPVAGTTTTTTTVISTTVVPTTSAPPTIPTTTVPADVDYPAVLWFFADNADGAPGPFLIPVVRTIDHSDVIGVLLDGLILGPRPDEVEAGLSSAIPAITSYGYTEGPIVTVDLPAEFVSGGGSLSMTGRLAQVVYTLTGLPGIDGVRFEIDGEPTTVFGGEGVVVNDPATRADFADLLPPVLIESPAYGGTETGNPLRASGTANVFEATVSIELLDESGFSLFEGFTTATCGTGCRGFWQIDIPYEVTHNQYGTLRAFEHSAEDGREINVREHPVWLVESDGSPATTVPPAECSGQHAAPELVEQPALPDEIAATREAIWAAARECRWEALGDLNQVDRFAYIFDHGVDPIGYWQMLEPDGADGEEGPMYYLAEMLNRPFGILKYQDGEETITHYVWPSAFNQGGWDLVSPEDVEALRPVYDDEDFSSFAQFGGYFGYRIGILDDGTWIFFLAGD